jgi:hypothetical protein
MAVGLVVGAAVACATGKSARLPQELQRKANVVDYSSEGKLWFVGVNARVSRMTGPVPILPLQVLLVDKNAGPATISREGFVLEAPDGTLLPVISYRQFDDEYRRDRADLKAGEEYIERFNGRFPSPPFTWRDLEFFPPRNSAVVPREKIDTRNGELIHGYIYFGAPSEDYVFPEGKYKLLFRPAPGDETLVVELFPF